MISIHAPVKGATRRHFKNNVILSYFNPRAREGRDLFKIRLWSFLEVISIHAPVKGATRDASMRICHHIISIHAPVKGATITLRSKFPLYPDFNPRAREGRDCHN